MDLILSDIHANLPALKAVMRYVKRKTIHRFAILGDLVGYGAQPNQVLECIQELKPRFMVRGNHDRACAWPNEDDCFSLSARQAAAWTREHLTLPHVHFLRELPVGQQGVEGDYLIAHGSPADEDAYILQPREALRAFTAFAGPLCFFGHTHLPCVFELDEVKKYLDWLDLEEGKWFTLRPHCRYLINPGSVGQPRDRNNQASFMMYDPQQKRIKLHRIDYDINEAAQAIAHSGLNPNLGERLFHGV